MAGGQLGGWEGREIWEGPGVSTSKGALFTLRSCLSNRTAPLQDPWLLPAHRTPPRSSPQRPQPRGSRLCSASALLGLLPGPPLLPSLRKTKQIVTANCMTVAWSGGHTRCLAYMIYLEGASEPPTKLVSVPAPLYREGNRGLERWSGSP